MEWFGEKMLPNGLPNLTYQIVPGWLSKRLKIVVHSRVQQKGWKGWKGDVVRINGYFRINLYPTVILKDWSGKGVRSYKYWHDFLRVILHEIGHAMTHDKRRHISDTQYWKDSNARSYVERLADNWCYSTMDKIGRRLPRLGQPEGWIGGLPGIYLMRYLESSKANKTFYVPNMVQNYRATKCHGQFTFSDVADEIRNRNKIDYSNTNMIKVKQIIKKVSPSLGINRHYIDRAGRKHLFFNYGESKLIINSVCTWFANEGKNLLQELTNRNKNQNGFELVSGHPKLPIEPSIDHDEIQI